MSALRQTANGHVAASLGLKIVASVVSALAVAGIATGINAWSRVWVIEERVMVCRGRLDGALDLLQRVDEESRANTIHRMEHDKTAAFWIGKISDNERELHRLTAILEEMKRKLP